MSPLPTWLWVPTKYRTKVRIRVLGSGFLWLTFSLPAFLNATEATDFGAIFSNGIWGILGLAFDQGSDVYVDTIQSFGMGNKQGRTFLGNIFSQDPSAPNLFSVLLGRTDDPDGPQEGLFTVSEYEPEYKAVAQQPKLHRTPAQLKNLTALPRWSVVMDKMTINGQDFQFNQSVVEGIPEGSTVTVLDTGFTFSQIPGAAVDAIYSSIEGAVYNETAKLWEVPCNASTKLEFTFGYVFKLIGYDLVLIPPPPAMFRTPSTLWISPQ